MTIYVFKYGYGKTAPQEIGVAYNYEIMKSGGKKLTTNSRYKSQKKEGYL